MLFKTEPEALIGRDGETMGRDAEVKMNQSVAPDFII